MSVERTSSSPLYKIVAYFMGTSNLDVPTSQEQIKMSINYHQKIFKSVSNTDNGEVGEQTLFHYQQKGNVVWAEYSGGAIVKGFLVAKVIENDALDMRYEHINSAGEIMTGKCSSTPEVLPDGRIRLYEKWQWTSGDLSSGESIIEEIIP